MRIQVPFAVAFLLLAFQLAAGATVTPVRPSIGSTQFIVTQFGAIGDGKTLNTDAVQKALDAAAAAVGTVVVPAGRYYCGPLQLHGKTELRLDSGAVLLLRNDVDAFPAQDERYLNFITIDKGATDVRISGSGTIDGQGAIWWERFTAKTIDKRRPQLLFGQGIQRLEISGVRFLNPPNTHISLKDCSEVLIRGIRIEAPDRSRNTDGINISARNCLIEDCDIATGDDNIAINFGGKNFTAYKPECENIEIRNCRFGHGHGLSIGSYTAGHLRGLDVHDCSFEGTTSAIRIKSARGRGGVVENVSYRNITITGSKWPVFISAYYPKEPKLLETAPEPVSATTPQYRNIRVSNLVIRDAGEALRLFGLPEAAISNVTFENCSFSAITGMRISHAKGVRFTNSSLEVSQGTRITTENADVSGLSN